MIDGAMMLLVVLQWGAIAVLYALWIEERDQRRDYATDLAQLIYDYDLDSRDLRRSLEHKEIRRAVERQYGEEVVTVDEVNDD